VTRRPPAPRRAAQGARPRSAASWGGAVGPDRAALRQRLALRGAAAAGASTLVAALSHGWAGGALPAPLIVVALAALLVVPGMALMGVRPNPVRIAVAVPALQVGFHLAFEALGRPVSSGLAVGHADHAGHAHGDAIALLVGGASGAPLDAAMLAAHALAAVVTFLLLAFGERAVVAVARWARARLRRLVTAPAGSPVVPAIRASVRFALRSRLGGRLACPRGPPLLAA